MSNHNNQISVTYTDTELRTLIEEYITQQISEFTLKGVCSYVLYWAVEDGKTSKGNGLIGSDVLQQSDQDRAKRVLETVAADGRIVETTSLV